MPEAFRPGALSGPAGQIPDSVHHRRCGTGRLHHSHRPPERCVPQPLTPVIHFIHSWIPAAEALKEQAEALELENPGSPENDSYENEETLSL
jgi:hypothetical protein